MQLHLAKITLVLEKIWRIFYLSHMELALVEQLSTIVQCYMEKGVLLENLGIWLHMLVDCFVIVSVLVAMKCTVLRGHLFERQKKLLQSIRMGRQFLMRTTKEISTYKNLFPIGWTIL